MSRTPSYENAQAQPRAENFVPRDNRADRLGPTRDHAFGPDAQSHSFPSSMNDSHGTMQRYQMSDLTAAGVLGIQSTGTGAAGQNGQADATISDPSKANPAVQTAERNIENIWKKNPEDYKHVDKEVDKMRRADEQHFAQNLETLARHLQAKGLLNDVQVTDAAGAAKSGAAAGGDAAAAAAAGKGIMPKLHAQAEAQGEHGGDGGHDHSDVSPTAGESQPRRRGGGGRKSKRGRHGDGHHGRHHGRRHGGGRHHSQESGGDDQEGGQDAPLPPPDSQTHRQDSPTQQHDGNDRSDASAGRLGNNGNAKQAWDFFRSKGLTKEQTAGILGNLQQENGFKTNDSSEGLGIAQWLGSRRTEMRNFARQTGRDSHDFGAQLDFIWKELNTTEKGAMRALQNSHTATQAADAFSKKYERPGKPMLARREAYANQFLRQFGNDD